MNIRIKDQLERYFNRTSGKKENNPLKLRLKKLTNRRTDVGINLKMRLGGEWIHRSSIMKFVHSEPFHDITLNELSRILSLNSHTRLRLSEIAFLDIETTGKNMGVGTLAFLIGICFIKEDTLFAEQYLLTSIDSEGIFLRVIKEKLGKFNVFASYNGLSFDIPFLLGRYQYHRISPPQFNLHIDLYHLTKRIFASPGGYRLTEIENYLLRRGRDVDLPSNLVPHAFFRFIRLGDTRTLRLAISHNRYDIISLPLLLTKLENMVSSPKVLFGSGTLYKIGKMYFSLREYSKAEKYLKVALQNTDSDQKIRILRLLGRIYKRQKRYNDAVGTWLRITQVIGSDQEANRELAIVHEHRFKDFEKAYYFACRLNSETMDTQRRLQRLMKKMKFSPSHRWDLNF